MSSRSCMDQFFRHCEKQRDEAISSNNTNTPEIATLISFARNDDQVT